MRTSEEQPQYVAQMFRRTNDGRPMRFVTHKSGDHKKERRGNNLSGPATRGSATISVCVSLETVWLLFRCNFLSVIWVFIPDDRKTGASVISTDRGAPEYGRCSFSLSLHFSLGLSSKPYAQFPLFIDVGGSKKESRAGRKNKAVGFNYAGCLVNVNDAYNSDLLCTKTADFGSPTKAKTRNKEKNVEISEENFKWK